MAFTRFTKSVLNVSALPDRVQNQASTLKATFDQAGVDIKDALNALTDELEANTSAGSIGARNTQLGNSTVQAELDLLNTKLTNKVDKTSGKQLSTEDYTTEEKLKLASVAEGANNYVLPEASTTTLGGIKVDGSTIVIEDGVAKAKASDAADYTARAAIEELETDIQELKEYVDESGGITILEASTDNVIDFNTLTEPGLYLIKNCSDGAGTTINSPYTNSSYVYDIFLEVAFFDSTDGESHFIYQRAVYGNGVYTNRNYLASRNPQWLSWANGGIMPSAIFGGVLANQITANATVVANLDTSQIRNIKAQTTDLTAGTSTLATGDIVFVYE